MNNSEPVALFWFRRDLRLEDNAGLWHALRSGYRVLPLFIFDSDILDRLEEKHDRRISLILEALDDIHKKLLQAGSSLTIIHDTPLNAVQKILSEFNVKALFANHDYEPYAQKRDSQVKEILKSYGIPFHTFKDQVIFEKGEIVKQDGTPYTVFTPYSAAWKKRVTESDMQPFPSETLTGNFLTFDPVPLPSEADLGFFTTDFIWSAPLVDTAIVRNYHKTRDFPSVEGTTRLGHHLRFGTLSIRSCVKTAISLNETWLNELIWREFFMAILWHFPHVTDHSFKRRYDNIVWRNDEAEFRRWCKGTTGFPIVDAGMRELNATGFMHNRIRMITASFLTKHLLTDWRWGEAWFAEKLLDYELSSNNGNWQWAAGCGCDAAPYFRVFSPAAQTGKFDHDMLYVRRWVPELDSPAYPSPVVDHRLARERALQTYRKALAETDMRK